MATHTRAELPVIFDCNAGEDGLAEFEPEAERDALWLREESPATVDVQRWRPDVTQPEQRRWPFVLPVLVAGVIAGGLVSWLGPGTGSASLPATARVPVSHLVPEGPTRVPPDVPMAPPERAGVAEPAATARPTEPVTARLDPAFEQTLARVSEAYRERDAEALAAVWPGADTAALSRAFADLKYQTLSFDHCAVHPRDAASAVATCEAVIATASKAGDPTLQRRRESWTLLLDRSGDPWTITGASAR